MKYIQFIGTQRSGSNLLRVMLNQLPEISAPHPPHILRTFYPLLPKYGDLSKQGNYFELVEDVCEWVNKNPVPWENITLIPKHIASICQEKTLLEIFEKIYETKALVDKAVFWCCKSMENIYYVKEIEASALRPFYIYIYRDGRDVALSFKKAYVGPKHLYHLALKWQKEQELSLQFLDSLEDNRYIVVRYEELIKHPHKMMELICYKMNIRFTESIFDFYHSPESMMAAKSGSMWKNLTKPIIQNNFNKFKTGLAKDEIELFERVAGDILERLNYEIFAKNRRRDSFSQERILKFDEENILLMKESRKLAKADEIKSRMPQEELLKRILSKPLFQHP